MLVLLLGAGFSSYAGLPTMAQFGGVFHERMRRLKEPIEIGIVGAKKLEESGRTFDQFRHYCRRSLSFIDVDCNNLEELFCAAEAMKEAGSDSILLDCGPTSIDEIIEALEMWTWNVYQGLPDYFQSVNEIVIREKYKHFMTWLAPMRERTTVLTTNYDLLFEQIASRENVPLQHPFTVTQRTHLWVTKRKKSYLAESSDSLLLCKLHGSVSFFKPEPKSTDIKICSDVAHLEDGLIGNSGVSRHRPHPAVICLGALGQLRKDYGESLTPAIIPPTYAKLQQTEWLQETWKKAVEALQEAKVLIIMGYSIPSSDGFMRAMFLSAMAKRETDNPLHVVMVSPDKAAAARVADLFRPVVEESRYLWRARRFEDWSPSDDPKLKLWLS